MKRLSLDKRINLQAAIAKNFNLKQTSLLLKVHKSTVYREIINNCRYVECRHSCSHCKFNCRPTQIYMNGCPNFQAKYCINWKHFPYTCNGCPNAKSCCHYKRYYDCEYANELSVENRSKPRQYKKISIDNLKIIDEITYKGIVENGQSIHHCYIANPVLWKIASERTIRRYIYRGFLRAKTFHLKRFVRYKRTYEYKREKVANVERMLGRTYSDFLEYVKEHPDAIVWQYDSVEGKKSDKKAILTITLPKHDFQFGILIAKQKSASVLGKIRSLQKTLGDKYKQIFMVNLSDNGLEFASFHEIEFDQNGEQICKVFFTNPYKATDKPDCERNHEFIRYVIPKGKSLDYLTQEKVNLLFSHINSYVRESKNNKTPYELVVESLGLEFIQATGVTKIDKKDVHLKEDLLK